jgi:predicted dehydrogenase
MEPTSTVSNVVVIHHMIDSFWTQQERSGVLKEGNAMEKTLGVGIIGASADRGWAKISHVPAVQHVAGLELIAVASGSQAKADAAVKAFGARTGYADGKELIRDADVDIVAICVKVPDHRELVLAALEAGKHIYCEWPLGRGLAESEELAAAGEAAGVHVAIGLQTRLNPATVRAESLIASGAIGRVLSARVLSTTVAFGSRVEEAMAFGEDAGNGVTLITIQGAHTLDFAIAVLGDLADLSALTTIQFPEVEIGEPARKQKRSVPDHLLTQSALLSGSALSIEVAGGRPMDATPFQLEVTGEKGQITLQGGTMRGFQSGLLTLSLNGQPERLDRAGTGQLPDTAVNVASVYAALRDDIAANAFTVPDFQHAVRLTRLIDDLLSSAKSGTRKHASEWPRQK